METLKNFLKDIASHSMKIIRDDGLHRHLSFSNNGSFNCKFDLITWPGHLVVTGDCGTYSFSRIQDMFQFFRSKDSELDINPRYWGEKLTSVCSVGGYKKYSAEAFQDAVKSDFESWEFESDEEKNAVWADIESTVLFYSDEGEYRAHIAASDYESDYGHQFCDFWEHDLTDYQHHYIWNLYAIVWGVQQYDNSKSVKAA